MSEDGMQTDTTIAAADPVCMLQAAREVFFQQRSLTMPREAIEELWSLTCAVGAGHSPRRIDGTPRTFSMPAWSTDLAKTTDTHLALQMSRDFDLSFQSASAIASGYSCQQNLDYETPTSSSNNRRELASLAVGTDAIYDNHRPHATSISDKKRRRAPSLPPVIESATTFKIPQYSKQTTIPDADSFIPAPMYTSLDWPVSTPYERDSRASTSDFSYDCMWTSSPPNSSAGSSPVTDDFSSVSMSRSGSGSSFFVQQPLPAALHMLRIQSDASYFSFSPVASEALVCPSESQDHFNAHDLAHSHSTSHIILNRKRLSHPSVTFSSLDEVDSASSSQLPSYSVAPSMQRSDSNRSIKSHSSSQTHHRSVRRHHEQLTQQKNCHIAPKIPDDVKVETHKTTHIKSFDGLWKEVGVIPRRQRSYQRPQHSKLYCPYCADHPEGFRGEHELQRHTNRAHAKTRRVWICVDSTPEGNFLTNCKACRTRKRYGAYYNAAAHLRRAHFNPRKRGRKAKTEAEKRGGKGGGNWPPMDLLKRQWMREIEEVVDEDIDENIQSRVSESAYDVGESESFDHQAPDFSTLADVSSSALVVAPLPSAPSCTTVERLLKPSVPCESAFVDPAFTVHFDMPKQSNNFVAQAPVLSYSCPQTLLEVTYPCEAGSTQQQQQQQQQQ